MSDQNKCLYCYEMIDHSKKMELSMDYHVKCCLIFFNTDTVPSIDIEMESLQELATKMIHKKDAIPGVQTKISLSLIRDITNQSARLTILDALEGNFILKPQSGQFKILPENESLTMRLANRFGIITVPNSLIRLKSNELAYITKRIDRHGESKLHMLDFFQILEAFDKYRSSYDAIGRALGLFSQNGFIDRINFFEIILFCFITGNSDMHLKNFSLILKEDIWQLAPAYDLLNVKLALPEDLDDTALTLGGKKRKLKLKDFAEFGKNLGLNEKQINNAIEKIFEFKSSAFTMISDSFLSDELKSNYKEIVEERINRIKV